MKNLNKKLSNTAIICVCLVLVPLGYLFFEPNPVPMWPMYAICVLLAVAAITAILALIRHWTGADQYDDL